MNEKEIFIELYKRGLIKTIRHKPEGWKLVSGIWSPFYIQLRLLPSHPDLLNEIGILLGEKIKSFGNKLLGIAMAGIPISPSTKECSPYSLLYFSKSSMLFTPANFLV